MGEKTTRAAPQKKAAVKRISELLKTYPVVGLIDLQGLPASQFQKIRAELGSKLVIAMARKSLIQRALNEAKGKLPGIELVFERLHGMPALLFTKENPFALNATIQKTKSKAPIKPGQQAPYDLVVPAGPTPFQPGPIISELASMRIKASIESGKVVVKQDATVAHAGDTVNGPIASLLQRLGIEPMEIGLTLTCFLEKGMLYGKEALSYTPDVVMAELLKVGAQSHAFAVELGWLVKETVEAMLIKAERQARAIESETARAAPAQAPGQAPAEPVQQSNA